MAKILMLSAMLTCGIASLYADYGYVTLNNGNVIEGQIIENESEITVITPQDKSYTYPRIEVYKISDEASTVPPVAKNPSLVDYMEFERGFWMRANFNASASIFVSHTCTPIFDLTIAGGYRFSQFLKVGIGLGARIYVNNEKIRCRHSMWAMPIFATIEGNFINESNRTVTPYYSYDIGASISDGFMMRPTVGLRIGQARSAFTVGITYTGQDLKYAYGGMRKFVSCLGVSMGYEY
ncbi:MAG: hypothetical protein K2H86_01495 [Muribaculaceae bacterium]|nr:hypothetical protein [Muribaculaceae bacterium]